LPIGGYSFPSFETFGSQEHHSASGIAVMTLGTCLPQPHHVDFSLGHVSELGGARGEEGIMGMEWDGMGWDGKGREGVSFGGRGERGWEGRNARQVAQVAFFAHNYRLVFLLS